MPPPIAAGSGSQNCSSDDDHGRTLYWPGLNVLVQSNVPGWLGIVPFAGTSVQIPRVIEIGGTMVEPLKPNHEVQRWISVMGPVLVHWKSLARIIAGAPGCFPWPTSTSKPL